MREASDKTIIVTGGTSGIGQQTAMSLARLGARVIVTGRDQQRGDQGLQTIRRESGNDNVHLLLCDLSKRTEIVRLAEEVMQRYPQIDVLINNAGAFATAFQKSSDGYELCFGMNVAAPFFLTRQLLPALKAASPSRVVNLTGGNPKNALDVTNLQAENGFLGLMTYDHSKRAAEAMSLALARELAPEGVFLNIVYPGQAATSMTRSVRTEHMPWYMRPMGPLFRWMMRDDGGKGAAKASRSSVWAATEPALEGVSGRYFDTHCKPAQLHRTVQDHENQARVIELLMPLGDASL